MLFRSIDTICSFAGSSAHHTDVIKSRLYWPFLLQPPSRTGAGEAVYTGNTNRNEVGCGVDVVSFHWPLKQYKMSFGYSRPMSNFAFNTTQGLTERKNKEKIRHVLLELGFNKAGVKGKYQCIWNPEIGDPNVKDRCW